MQSDITFFEAYKNKITHKLFGAVHLSALSQSKTQKNKENTVLLSYLTAPFIQAPGEKLLDPHSSYWECAEIARLFRVRGFDVDVINHDNSTFIPKKQYRVCIDIMQNLERLAPFLSKDCKKVLHIVSAYPEFQNNAETKRISSLKERFKNREDNIKNKQEIKLEAKRTNIVSKSPEIADFLEGFGNITIQATYSQFHKPIFSVPISVAKEYEFQDKNFEANKKNFVWFGGGGAIHKGLDLVIEAFSQLSKSDSDFKLHIIGPAVFEKDFQEIYKRELELPNIFIYSRPRFNNSGELVIYIKNKNATENQKENQEKNILDIFNQCDALIYPSCSEGTSGAVVQAMHAGLIPIITPETGISEKANSFAQIISEPTVEKIIQAVKNFSELSGENIKKLSRETWQFAQKTYTQENFSKKYSEFIDTVLLK